MTNLQRKKAQAELELLLHRKTKAEALGPETIRENQSLYDSICARITELQDDLAVDEGGIIADLLNIQRQLLNLAWEPGMLEAVLLTDPLRKRRLEAAERELIAAHNQRAGPRCRKALEAYRFVMCEIHALLSEDPQISFDDWEEVIDEELPWDRPAGA